MINPLDPKEFVATSEPTVRAGVAVGGVPLRGELTSRLLRVVVDNDLHLPGMFELTFLDLDGATLAMANIEIGSVVSVTGSPATTTSFLPPASAPLIVGEVTSIEGLIDGLTIRTVVRGYTAAHRLQRARRSRTFVNSTDADVARQLAAEAGIALGTVVATSVTHAHLPQVNQTDWEFLTARAAEIGFEVGVEAGAFYFRPATNSLASAGGGLTGLARSVVNAVADAATSVTVTFPKSLLSFRPRVTAGNLTPDVEVRSWDPLTRSAVAQQANTPFGVGPTPNALGRQFAAGAMSRVTGGLEAAAGSLAAGSVGGAASSLASAAGEARQQVSSMTGGVLGSPIGYLGPPPSRTAHVVSDRPVGTTATMPAAGPMVAGALGSDVGSTYAEAEGEAKGNPAIQPGATVDVDGVPFPFGGSWKVSRARHVFDDSRHGYRTTFSAHGRQDRTMLGLTSKSGRRAADNRATIDGVVCGVVSNCGDPLGKGRVKVTLPWLAPDFETDWAPNVQFCSGQRSGAMFMPEIGDEVLVAFEFGDPRRPYVLGGMMNNFTQWSVAAAGPIFAGGLLGLGSAAAGMAGSMAGAAAGAMVGGGVGMVIGGAIGSQLASQAANEATGSIAGSVLTPGMVSEVHHRGFVSSTGNALLFYDMPVLPAATPSVSDATAALGVSADLDGGGTTPGLGSITPEPALASAVRLGSQRGEIGVTIDQVNGGVNISANPVVGVTTTPVSNINISTLNGFINISAGAAGTMLIDGGANLIIKSATAITLQAPTVNILGLPLINGVPIPI